MYELRLGECSTVHRGTETVHEKKWQNGWSQKRKTGMPRIGWNGQNRQDTLIDGLMSGTISGSVKIRARFLWRVLYKVLRANVIVATPFSSSQLDSTVTGYLPPTMRFSSILFVVASLATVSFAAPIPGTVCFRLIVFLTTHSNVDHLRPSAHQRTSATPSSTLLMALVVISTDLTILVVISTHLMALVVYVVPLRLSEQSFDQIV